jgi:hypothetical protein
MTNRNWVELNNHPNYEITTHEPWKFRHQDKQGNYRIINPWFNKKIGYYYVDFDTKHHLLHRLVAEQFISNPDNLPEIDHKNHDRTDNCLGNIRWVSSAVNSRNISKMGKIKYEFLDALPEGFEPFTEYQLSTGRIRYFKDLYMKYEDGVPKFITGDSEHKWRRLYTFRDESVSYHDTSGKYGRIMFSRINKTQNRINKTQNRINTTQQGINETQQQINQTQQMMIETINKLIDTIADKK